MSEQKAKCPDCEGLTLLRYLAPQVEAFYGKRWPWSGPTRTHQLGAIYSCEGCGLLFRVLEDGVHRLKPKSTSGEHHPAQPAEPRKPVVLPPDRNMPRLPQSGA